MTIIYSAGGLTGPYLFGRVSESAGFTTAYLMVVGVALVGVALIARIPVTAGRRRRGHPGDPVESTAVESVLLLAAKPWHYWIAPFFTIGIVLTVVAVLIGYVVKVIYPRTPRR